MNKNVVIILGEIGTAVAIYIVIAILLPIEFGYICPFDHKEYQTTLAFYSAALYLFSALYVTLLHIIFSKAEQKTLSAYKKQYEKTSIEHAEKDDVIKALENKVKTLETALDSVLKKEK